MEENPQKDITVQHWIEVSIGTYNHIIGFDELIKEMESVGSVHIRKKWYPACCTGFELNLVVKVGTWLANTLLSGIAYDLIKAGVNKLIESLCKLFAANGEDMELQTLTLDYDDTTICFDGISGGRMSGLAEFFNSLPDHMEWLRQHGVKNIDRISLPIQGETLGQLEESGVILNEYDSIGADYFCIWSISYDYGCNHTFYDSKHQKLL